jgi:apolipoprotein N-acyltransferase
MKKKPAPPDTIARPKVKPFFVNLALTVVAVLLFAGSFPNLIITNGFPFFAWFAYVPIFILLKRVGLAASVFWGALYGYAAYGLFNYWLGAFHPLAGTIVGLIYLVFLATLFFLLKLADILFPRRGYLVQWIIWPAYEYLRTLGFLGYPYGITGYSQWTMIPLIQIAGIFGVWGVSALVVFPSAWLGAALGGNSLAQRHKEEEDITQSSQRHKEEDFTQRCPRDCTASSCVPLTKTSRQEPQKRLLL